MNEPQTVQIQNEDAPLVGVDQFVRSASAAIRSIAEVSQNSGLMTRGYEQGSDNPTELNPEMNQLINLTLSLLSQNDIDVNELLEEENIDVNHPAFAALGLGIVEYDWWVNNPDAPEVTVGGCVLEAFGLRSLFEGGAKKITVKIAKQILKRAIPYVGTAITVSTFAVCMFEKYKFSVDPSVRPKI